MIIGGLFLLGKSTFEIHERLEGEEGHASEKVAATLGGVIVQIMLLDIVFSLDSVITAVGMVDEIAIMVTAVVIAVGIMLFASGPISDFVNDRPTLEDPGPQFPAADRFLAGRRRLGDPYPQRLYLLRNGLFCLCGSHQPPGASQNQASPTAQALYCGEIKTLMEINPRNPSPGSGCFLLCCGRDQGSWITREGFCCWRFTERAGRGHFLLISGPKNGRAISHASSQSPSALPKSDSRFQESP